MKKIIVIVGWENGNYSASCEVGGVVVDVNNDLEALKKSFADLLRFHIEGCVEDGDDIPAYLVNGDYELEFELLISAVLHKYDKILTRSALSRVTGINEKQLGHYMSGHRKPRPEKKEQILNGIRAIGRELASV
ncbi:hypothetical protein AB4865_07380 [Capnocytophaga sp. ARDL2]|uniref:hypothetical protein n=1 Tax=Capnocytophaga sp. ARDL2 TaxID=3238809 RepID=UPI00355836F9